MLTHESWVGLVLAKKFDTEFYNLDMLLLQLQVGLGSALNNLDI
jgi:hypothetical protein